VVTYISEDLATTIKTGVHVVEFYAPWCGYCKQFAPEYEKVATHYLSSGEKIVIAKFDGTTDDYATEKEGIDSFPTLKMYREGVSTVYRGEFNKDSVVQFIQDKLTAKAIVLADETRVPEFIKENSVIVACVAERHDEAVDVLAFQAVSSTFKVGRLRCAEGSESLVLYIDGAKKTSYPADEPISDMKAVRRWYKRAGMNPVFRFDDSIFEEVMAAEYKYLVFYFNDKLEGTEPEIQVMQELANAGTPKDTAYCYATSSDEYLLQFFQVKLDSFPATRILEIQGATNSYMGPSVVSKETITEALQKLEQGKLEKLAPPSQDQASGEDENSEYAEHEHDEDEESGRTEGEEEFEDEEFEGDDFLEEEEEPFDEEDDDDEYLFCFSKIIIYIYLYQSSKTNDC